MGYGNIYDLIITSYIDLSSVADDEGRILLIDITVEDHDFILCNIYAPTKDKAKEQQSFLIKLKDMLTPYIDRDLFIGGDLIFVSFQR